MQQGSGNRRGGRYDKVMRENLEKPGVLLLDYFFPGEVFKTEPMLPKIRQHIIEKETDKLVLMKVKGKKPFIFHLEFQSTNHKRMAARMASYDYMLHLKYNMDVVSVVIYIGNKPMKMNNSVSFNGNHYACRLIDIREMDPELFLRSDEPKEVVLAILAGNDRPDRRLMIRKILARLMKLLPGKEAVLKERIQELEILSALRGNEIQQQIIEEEQKMPITYDIRKDLRFQQGRSEGRSEGKSEGKSEGISTIALRMLKDGMAVTLIHKYTGLAIAELERLANEGMQKAK